MTFYKRQHSLDAQNDLHNLKTMPGVSATVTCYGHSMLLLVTVTWCGHVIRSRVTVTWFGDMIVSNWLSAVVASRTLIEPMAYSASMMFVWFHLMSKIRWQTFGGYWSNCFCESRAGCSVRCRVGCCGVNSRNGVLLHRCSRDTVPFSLAVCSVVNGILNIQEGVFREVLKISFIIRFFSNHWCGINWASVR